MGKVITVFNQKGGVGKTTTVVNLACAIERKGKRVLVVDMDPQGNASSGLGVEKREVPTVYDLLSGEKNSDQVIFPGNERVPDIIPANNQLAGIEIALAQQGNWHFLLKKVLENIPDYDFVFIDSPPSLGILSLMSLAASDSILIPVQCEYYALEGVGNLMETISLVKDNFNGNLKIEGVVLTMVDMRTNLSLQVMEEVKEFFGDKVYETLISRTVRLAEAPSFGQDIFSYDEKSKGAELYSALAGEFLKEQ